MKYTKEEIRVVAKAFGKAILLVAIIFLVIILINFLMQEIPEYAGPILVFVVAIAMILVYGCLFAQADLDNYKMKKEKEKKE